MSVTSAVLRITLPTIQTLFSAIVSERLRRLIGKPKLTISFSLTRECNERLDNGFIMLRLKVSNRKNFNAVGCRAFLSYVKMPAIADPNLVLAEAVSLMWSGGREQVDVRKQKPEYIDLAGFGRNKKLAFTPRLPEHIGISHQTSSQFICTVTVVSDSSEFSKTFALNRNYDSTDFYFMEVAVLQKFQQSYQNHIIK